MARFNDGVLRLHGENVGERGPGELERLGANRRVPRVAGEGAKLTEATDVTDAQRWPRNGGDPSAKFHGSARRARERARVLG
jgi:hypothetical protein